MHPLVKKVRQALVTNFGIWGGWSRSWQFSLMSLQGNRSPVGGGMEAAGWCQDAGLFFYVCFVLLSLRTMRIYNLATHEPKCSNLLKQMIIKILRVK